jgi:hypothetical protein
MRFFTSVTCKLKKYADSTCYDLNTHADKSGQHTRKPPPVVKGDTL